MSASPREPVLVHIGLHKTATTWLQNAIFENAEWGFASPWPRAEILDRFVLVDPMKFAAEPTRRALQPGWERANGAGSVAVLSHERLSGNPHSGGYDRRTIAERLAAVWPEARVLIVIREQRDMIRSVYRQYLREGGALSLRRYLAPSVQGQARAPAFSAAFFEYDALIDGYRRLFDSSRVLVLCYESLREDPKAFVSRIAEFAGARGTGPVPDQRENVALSDLALLVKRPLNRVLVRDRLNPTGMFESPRFHAGLVRALELAERALPRSLRHSRGDAWREVIESVLGEDYAVSNRRTKELTGLPLEELGYAT